MTSTNRRIALLTGASLAALGMASPAFAAAPHTGLADGTYPGATSTLPLVDICDLDPTPLTPCFFGVIDHDPSLATANVTSTANGQIVHNPGAKGTLENAGSAEIGAIASAARPGATGGALAAANVSG